ncbi:unnamed protein product [Absidia cylindrospora]
MDTLEPELTKSILERIPDWKLAITPSGKLAKQSSFVQKYMPPIIALTQDESTALMVTHSAWTHRLVDQGVLWDTSNDSTIHSLSMAQLLFYPQQHAQNPLTYAKKTLHMILFQTCACFSVNQILRPTLRFQQAIETALIPYPMDFRQVLENLMGVFNTYGFLWPQKIILGRRIHVKKSYKVYTTEERLMHLRIAKDDVLLKLTKEREAEANQRQSDSTMDQESLTWTIIKRNDVCPIYEFLDEPWRQQIQHVIHECLYRIPIHAPIKLRNYSTNTYLSWRSNNDHQGAGVATKRQHQFQQDKQSCILSALPMKLMASTSSQYLWRFTWTPSRSSSAPYSALPDLVASYQPQFLRCGSTVYLSPACDTPLVPFNNSYQQLSTPPLTTHADILARSMKGDSRIRSVDLFNSETCDVDAMDSLEMTWKVDLPGLGLGRDDDSSTDEGLNMDILIGRCRPVLHKDIIALRQILYLCAVSPVTPPHQQQKSSNTKATAVTTSGTNKQPDQQPLSSMVHPILAKENGLVGGELEHCWWIELASEEDLNYHQHTFISWPPSPYDQQQNDSLDVPPIQQDNGSIRQHKSAESLRPTYFSRPNLRQVRSFDKNTQSDSPPIFDQLETSSPLTRLSQLMEDENEDKVIRRPQEQYSSKPTASIQSSVGLRKKNTSFLHSLSYFNHPSSSLSSTTTATTTNNNNKRPISNHQPLSTLPSTPSPSSFTSPKPSDQHYHEEVGFDTDPLANARAEPYFQFYASKQRTKTLTQVWKHSSLKQMITRLNHQPPPPSPYTNYFK